MTVSDLGKDARLGGRQWLLGPVLILSGLLLSGCMSAPTYGTGTPADRQLLSDVTGVLSLGPEDEETIAYTPRPGIVMPSATSVLPPPQEQVATADNPDWLVSPEERLARVRAEATANQDDPTYESGVERDVATGPRESREPRQRWHELPDTSDAAATREEFNERLAQSNQGSSTQRRYLSEPPLVYREAASSAPTGDVGEDEWKKERDARRKARPARMRDYIPGL